MGFESSYGYRGRPGIQEGKDLERGILGKPAKDIEKATYVSYREAMDEVLDTAPGVLSDAMSDLKSRVFNNVNPQFGFIKVRSALGTSLDLYHGVDAVMEYEGNIATIDITSNLEKVGTGAKADIILHATLDEDGVPAVNERVMEQAAADISRLLMGGRDYKQAA